MMKPSDRIASPSRATAAQAIQGLKKIVTIDNADEGFALALEEACTQGGIDFSIAWAHACNEADWLTDPDYTQANNAFGIAHPDDAPGGAVFRTKRECARFYVGELLLKLRRPIPSALADARSYAPAKWDQVEKIVGGSLGPFPTVETIADLNKRFGLHDREAIWMTDANGPAAICEKGNTLFLGLKDQEGAPPMPKITFGRVPPPPMEIRDIPDDVNTAWDDLGPRTIRAICWHRSQGTHRGNDAYFRGEGRRRALTDFGIGVLTNDGDLAGSIYRWNNPRGNRSPWANGPVSEPYGDGKAFVDRYGVTAVDRDVVSVEISGFYPVPGEVTANTPLDPKSREAISALTAYWADQAHIPWDSFPIVPAEDRSFVVWHAEFTQGTGKQCPGPVVKEETSALIARAKEIMRAAQTSAPPKPVYAPRVPIPGAVTDKWVNGRLYLVAARKRVTVRDEETVPRNAPSIVAPAVGPMIPLGTVGTYEYVVTGDGALWRASKRGTYVLASAFEVAA